MERANSLLGVHGLAIHRVMAACPVPSFTFGWTCRLIFLYKVKRSMRHDVISRLFRCDFRPALVISNQVPLLLFARSKFSASNFPKISSSLRSDFQPYAVK